MAQSRLEKIGTIFTRVSGLLRSGAMKAEDKPIWYDVHKAFPPKLEPRFDRPAPDIPIRRIFYEEDVVRAKFHKSMKQIDQYNLNDTKRETQTQQFIKIYNNLQAQGALDSEQIFTTALEILNERKSQAEQSPESDPMETSSIGLSQSFEEAREAKKRDTDAETARKPGSKSGINIENIFKD